MMLCDSGMETKMKVLIVDDNITDLNGVCDFTPWDKLGCQVVGTARNGKDGLLEAQKTMPDLIIADISMPVMDGITMCQQIREVLPNVHVIFLSCLEDFDMAKRAINLGRCEYITKPLEIDSIIKSILKIKNAHESEIKKELRIFNLEKEMKKLHPYLVRNFLRDVLLDISPNKGFNNRQARELDIDVQSNYCIILFEINNISDEYSIVNLFLTDMLNSVLLPAYSGWIIDIGYGLTAAVLTGDVDYDKLIEVLSDIQVQVSEEMEVSLAICIGDREIKFGQLHNEFFRLNEILKDNLFSSLNSIVFADEIQTKDVRSINEMNFSELQNDISIVLQSEYDDAAVCMIEKYIQPGNEVDIKSMSCYIICNLNVVLYKMNALAEDISIEQFLTEVIHCKNYSEIKKCLSNIFLKCRKIVSVDNNTSAEYVVNRVKKIIHENYASIETIEDITDKLYISLLYANRIFKQYTGNTIYKYLIQVRMEKAVELLSNSSCNVGEIGEAVGFRTARYFSTVFKNYTGMTPKQYRIKSVEADKN